MTVAELISVLQEMDPTDLVVVGFLPKHSADMEYIAATDDVWRRINHRFCHDGDTFNVVVIEAVDD